MNTYREAVRARVLFGLLALALATSGYSLVIAAMSLRQETRIVADIGSSSMSFYAVLVSVILGATSLYRELELKTIFPILTRRLRRHEYVLGKYLGIFATLLVFVAIDGASVLTIMAIQSKQHVGLTIGVGVGMLAVLGILLWRATYSRVFVVLPWSIALFLVMMLLCDGAGDERQVVVVSALLTLAEVGDRGRDRDGVLVVLVALPHGDVHGHAVPDRSLGGHAGEHPRARLRRAPCARSGIVLAKVVPNLNTYVPARPLLLGQVASVPLWGYVGRAWMNSIFYAAVLLTLSAVIFRKRDFQ